MISATKSITSQHKGRCDWDLSMKAGSQTHMITDDGIMLLDDELREGADEVIVGFEFPALYKRHFQSHWDIETE